MLQPNKFILAFSKDRRKIISSTQEMDEFEKEEMKKDKPVVKNKLIKII